MFKQFISKVESIICAYLRLDREEVKAGNVKFVGKSLIVTHTTSYRRYLFKSLLDEFNNKDYHQHVDANLDCLGRALGKIIATDLVIKFEEPKFIKDPP
jgi:hypothetical protein